MAWDRRGQLSPAQRGYGKAHRAERARWEPLVKAGLVHCWRCGRLIIHDPRKRGGGWHLGHDDVDRRIIRGPEHDVDCNLRGAAKEARRRQLSNVIHGRRPISREW
jgi:hypothetical protein